MKKRLLFFIVLLSILNFSCKKREVQADGYFPNEPGYHWTYRWIADRSEGTIEVKILDSKKLAGGEVAKGWQYIYKNGLESYVDTVWVVSSDKDVSIYNDLDMSDSSQFSTERLHYILPLEVGNRWYANLFQGDTTRVLNQETVSVPAGSFSNVFRISKNVGFAANAGVQDTIYFKKNIGVVKFCQHEFNLGPVPGNGVWELVDYNF